MKTLFSRGWWLLSLVLVAIPSRAAAPAAAFCASAAGTVKKDLYTGLVWQNGREVGDWYEALSYCQKLKTGPYDSGWRLPTIKELATLANGEQSPSGALNTPDVFPDLADQPETYFFWSSTPMVGSQNRVWAIAFRDNVPYDPGFTMTIGFVEQTGIYLDNSTTLKKGYVRCVH